MTQPDVTYRGTVQQWHCDHMNHMNVMWYVGKFDEATWNFAAATGLTAQYLRDKHRGMAAVDQRIAYRRELVVGDTLTIRTAVLEVRPRSVRFVHEMRRGFAGELAATMLLIAVHIDTAARKAVAFEPEIAVATQALLAPDTTRWDEWPPAQAWIGA